MANKSYLETSKQNAKTITRVAFVTLFVNLLLCILKAIFGFMFNNTAVVADAMHSLSDAGATLIVIVAVLFSRPKPDKDHNYGHEKVEPLLVLFFSLLLGGVGVALIVQGINGLILPTATSINYFLLAVTVFSIFAKEGMYWFTRHFAKKTGSSALKADAWHHRSDSLSSATVLIGLIIGIFTKNNIAESVAVLLVAALIIKVAVQILLESVNQLTDHSASKQAVEELYSLVLSVPQVVSVDKLQTRLFGKAIYVDLEIGVAGDLTVVQSHAVAHAVHDTIENHPTLCVKHVNVHINPAEQEHQPTEKDSLQDEGEITLMERGSVNRVV